MIVGGWVGQRGKQGEQRGKQGEQRELFDAWDSIYLYQLASGEKSLPWAAGSTVGLVGLRVNGMLTACTSNVAGKQSYFCLFIFSVEIRSAGA